MIVVDASVFLAAQVSEDPQGEVNRRLDDDQDLIAPQHVKAEALSGLRRLVNAGEVTTRRAATVARRIRMFRIETYPVEPFIQRIWELRHNLSVYDAWYVALAEALEVPLVTTDGRLSRTPGIVCEVELIGGRPA